MYRKTSAPNMMLFTLHMSCIFLSTIVLGIQVTCEVAGKGIITSTIITYTSSSLNILLSIEFKHFYSNLPFVYSLR